MRKVFKQIIAILLIIVLQLNSVCCINAADFQKYDSTQNEMESNISIEGSDSFGNMIAEKAKVQTQRTSNYISGLTFSGNIAKLKFSVKQAAELVVAIYDEDDKTKMLTASKTGVSVGEGDASITLKKEELPSYFIAKAFLLDAKSHKPLCDAYTTGLYTKAICSLKESSVDDYAGREIVQFEKNNKNDNFGVYNDNTIVEKETSNNIQITDNENDTYTIKNADPEFKSLKKGDTFSYQYADGSLLLVKVSDISVKKDKIIVYSDTSADLADFFDYLKIDTDTSSINAQNDISDVPAATFKPVDKSYDKEKKFDDVRIDTFSVSGSIKLSASISYYLATELPKIDFPAIGFPTIEGPEISLEYFSFTFKYYIGYEIEIASDDLEFNKIPLFSDEISLPYGLTMPIELSVVCQASGKTSFSNSFEDLIGFSYEKGEGFCNRSEPPSINLGFKFSGSLYIGFEISIGVSIISEKLCAIKLKGTPGIESALNLLDLNSDIIHDCKECMNSTVSLVFKLEIVGEVKLASFNKILGDGDHDVGCTLMEYEKKIFDFYESTDYGDSGRSTCPHISYLVSVTVKNQKGLLIDNSKITVKDKASGETVKLRLKKLFSVEKTDSQNTAQSGIASFYLPKGTYIVKAEKGKYSSSEELTVQEKDDEHNNELEIRIDETLTPTPTNTPVPTITPTVSPVPIITPTDQDICSSGTDRNITWRLTKDGTLYISGTGKMPDYGYTYESPGNYVTIPAPWEEVKDKIKKVIIEEGICSVGNNAFNECTELLNIQLPSTITSIGESAFSLCTALKNITLPNKIQTVSANQFSGCSSLEKVVLPENLTRIEFQAFIHCYNLKEINMPEKLEYIGTWAFCNCKSLESISFSKYLTEISGGAFRDCVNLKQVVFAARKGSKKYPDMYITLSLEAFSGCKSLETITLEGVESLFGSVFYDCSNLREIYFTKNKPSISDNFLSGMDNVTIYYPTGDKTWNGIKSKTFGGKNVTWKAYAPDSVLQSSEATNASFSLETEFSDGKNVDINTFSSEEDSEQNESFSADNIQSNDSEDVDIVSVPEGKSQEVESSVNYERESISNSGNYQTYTDRYPGSYCLFVAVKNKNADDILNPDNLLYIDQKISDEKGTVSFSYTLKEAFNAPAFLVYGISAHTHSFNKWKTVSRATVFKPEVRQYICDICGMVEEREYGTKLKPVLKVSSSKVTLRVKQSTTGLKVTKMADGDSVVSWKSSNPKIVKVNKRGKLAAQSQTGKATVTVKLKSGISKKIAVTVQKNPVKTTKISGLKKTLSLQVGKRYTLKPILTPFTSSEKIAYSSSNRQVVSISSKGIVKGLKRGTAKITVQSGKKKFIITVRVK